MGETHGGLDLFYKAYRVVRGTVRDNAGNGLGNADAGRGPFIAFTGDAVVQGSDVLHINKRFKAGPTGAYTAYLPNGNYLVAPVPLPGKSE